MSVEITGHTATVRVGEKISLGVKFSIGWGVLKSVEWQIPGTIVKNYTDGLTTAEVTPVDPADKKKFTITFYWVDGADGRVVDAKCVFTSADGKDTNKTVSVTFDVKAPVLDKFDAATDAVAFDSVAAPTKYSFGSGGRPGIKWDWKVTVPGGVAGDLKDVQTIQTITQRTRLDGKKQSYTVPGTKGPPTHVQLDTANPYSQTDIFPKGFPETVPAGGSYHDTFTSDTPAQPLGGTRQFVQDAFKYYILYKPASPDSIWVPVAKAEWHWQGKAQLNTATGTWSLSGHAGGVTAAGAVTTEFPEYKSNVKNNAWQDD